MRCQAALPAALLLLLSGAAAEPAPAPAPCEPDYNETAASIPRPHCARLAASYHFKLKELGERCVSVRGRAARVRLVWGSGAVHAAAALVAALLRHVLCYRRVLLEEAPPGYGALAEHVMNLPETELVISLASAWQGEPAPSPRGRWQGAGLAGPRLAALGASWVPAPCRLHGHLLPRARALAACAGYSAWTFYTNATALELCGFVDAVADHDKKAAAAVYSPLDACGAAASALGARAPPAGARLGPPRPVPRAALLQHLATSNHSFLFLDHDIWEKEPNVAAVQPPPCPAAEPACALEPRGARALLLVADVQTLQVFAPQLYQFVNDFQATPETIKFILDRKADGADIEDAACEWAADHPNIVSKRVHNKYKYDILSYWTAVFYCQNDPDASANDKVLNVANDEMFNLTGQAWYTIVIRRYFINCSDDLAMSGKITMLTAYRGIFGLLGVLSAGTAGAAQAAGTAAAHGVPLLLLDAAADAAVAGAPTAWRLAGRPRHVLRALERFVLASGWARLAVLTDPTNLAKQYYRELQNDAKFESRSYDIPQNVKPEAKNILTKLQDVNARIIFINANSETAAELLTAALELRMSHADGYVWILRDWRPTNATFGLKHFTISLWSRGQEGIPISSGRHKFRTELNKTFGGQPWPPLAAALGDALLALARGSDDAFRRAPAARQDLHTVAVTRLFEESLTKKPVTGVFQSLHFKERTIEETFVFVDAWHGDKFDRLATWRVNGTSGAVLGHYTPPADLPSSDGATRCFASSGDGFSPNCYDYVVYIAITLIMVAVAALLQARRVFYRRLKISQIQGEGQRKHLATALAKNLVKRDAVELREKIGAGQFGCVHLAVLRAPLQASRYVAAKSLRDNAAPAEESEFLREACTIASLDHQHIVRLVGVCIADGPPLVLMELAFFGDLLGYLCARRHLVESSGLEQSNDETLGAYEEAVHVSAEHLTRLAREVAAALVYLGKRGIVHRDVRAANCLVDARRSLKLADFGMARHTTAGGDGAPEYACRRRGLFPVLWMAPESLAHGVFSAASDVWALGVLVLELVTLGARPYGAMSPLRVLEYVAAGGRPALPLDATPQTRGLTRLCWQREAERRPGAAEVLAYLAARPRALCPALLAEHDEPADADSGFGESPSTELLPSESPLDSLGHLDV